MQSQVCNISGDMQNLSKCPRHASCRVLIEASKTLHDLTPLPYNVILLPPSLASLGFYNAPNLFLPRDLRTCSSLCPEQSSL